MLTRSECFKILQLDDSSGPNAIKKAYRKLAFELHPDLNPDIPDASKRFQALNEAYVLLMQEYANTSFASGASKTGSGTTQAGKSDEKVKEDAQKAYQKAKGRFDSASASSTSSQKSAGSNNYTRQPSKEEVLNDLLNDPFAKRVFEDIYSSVQHKNNSAKAGTRDRTIVTAPKKRQPVRLTPVENSVFTKAGEKIAGLAGGVKGWLRKQIDDEQIMYVPKDSLMPGARIRLQVTHGLNDSSKVIELTLPPEFKPGRPIRLRGMGKQIGNWKGDLYLRVYAKEE